MQATTEKIKSLGDRSLQIYDIINLIHETNLLALNALMESSKKSGGPMDVLSGEMKKLGDHSRAATRDIVTLLKSIQAESNQAVAVMDQGNRVAENGARMMEQASQAFGGITEVLRQTADFADAISAASSQQIKGTEHVAGAVQELAANLRQDATKGRQAAKLVEQMARCSEQLTQAATQRPAPGVTVARPEKEAASAAAVTGRA
jgi:twitching motility protein PilJ